MKNNQRKKGILQENIKELKSYASLKTEFKNTAGWSSLVSSGS